LPAIRPSSTNLLTEASGGIPKSVIHYRVNELSFQWSSSSDTPNLLAKIDSRVFGEDHLDPFVGTNLPGFGQTEALDSDSYVIAPASF
jgi:hypothetical protein